MASLRRFSRFAVVASAAVTFSGAYVIFNSRRNPARASADTSPGFDSDSEKFADRLLFKPSGLRWDPNWDMCDKGERKSKKKDNGRIEEESKDIKPTAVRHLVFIRHGQYYLDAANGDDKRLTELGRYGKKSIILCKQCSARYQNFLSQFTVTCPLAPRELVRSNLLFCLYIQHLQV